MTDVSGIIDEIDQLVDEQMAGGEPVGGFDYNDPEFPKCPHCDGEFHGIPLTERILDMRHRTGWDENYRVDTDDSPMVCEGSLFIGPIRPPRIRVSEIKIGHNHTAPWVFFSEQVYEDSVVPGLSESVLGEMIRSAYLYAHDIATEVLGPREIAFERIRAIVDALVANSLLGSTITQPEIPNLLESGPVFVDQVDGHEWQHIGHTAEPPQFRRESFSGWTEASND
ncbi:hypothetical protein [Mycobacteroides chelonae]|uniref:hypothetical protein n=1 Tax=Mycobacteroides chelonae TaxID=1774 RepID=UPI0008A8D3F0|nr:hypothetical protein [Mycobacteroides chelonae]OHU38211.1 hypothetical protein BKG78_13080 [Mycobacteroides chelonae]